MSLVAVVCSKDQAVLWSDGFVVDAEDRPIRTDVSKLFRLPSGQILAAIGDAAGFHFAHALSYLPMETFELWEHLKLFCRQNPRCNAGFYLAGETGDRLGIWNAFYTGSGFEGFEDDFASGRAGLFVGIDGAFENRERYDEPLQRISALTDFDAAEHAMRELFETVRAENPHRIGGDTFCERISHKPIVVLRDCSSYARTVATALSSGVPIQLGDNSGDYLLGSGGGIMNIINSSGNIIAPAAKRTVATVPFSQTNGGVGSSSDGSTVYFNSADGSPYLQDSGGNAFPEFTNPPIGIVLQAQNPPSGLESFYASNVTTKSFKIVSKGAGSLTAYGITLTKSSISTGVTGGSSTSLDTTTDAYNTNVTQASGVTTQVQFGVVVATTNQRNTKGFPQFTGSATYEVQVWSGNMGTLLASGSFTVYLASDGQNHSGSLTLSGLSIAASSQFTVRIYCSAYTFGGGITSITGSATGSHTSAASVNGVDFIASNISETWS